MLTKAEREHVRRERDRLARASLGIGVKREPSRRPSSSERAIGSVLFEREGAVTLDELRATAGVKHGTLDASLRRMLSRGQLVRDEQGRYSLP